MTPERKNVTASVCPECGAYVDSATCINEEGAQPEVGDFTICIRCHVLLKFGYDYKLEPATKAEFDDVIRLIREGKNPNELPDGTQGSP
jgi:hypothetical protein